MYYKFIIYKKYLFISISTYTGVTLCIYKL